MCMQCLESMVLIIFIFFIFFLGQVKVFRALYTFEPRTVSISRFWDLEGLLLKLFYNNISLVLLGLDYQTCCTTFSLKKCVDGYWFLNMTFLFFQRQQG